MIIYDQLMVVKYVLQLMHGAKWKIECKDSKRRITFQKANPKSRARCSRCF